MAYYMVYLILTLFVEIGAMIMIAFVAKDKAERDKAARKQKMNIYNAQKAKDRENSSK